MAGPYAPALTTFGVAKETTKGTPAAAPTDFLRVKTLQPKDDITQLTDDALSGSMTETGDIVPGVRSVALQFGGNAHMDTIMYAVASLLGDLTTTGAGAPFTHAASVKNSGDGQPGAYTLWDYYGAGCRRYEGMECNDLELTFTGEGALQFSSSWMGLRETSVAKPTGAPSTTPLAPVYKLAVSIAGAPVLYLVDGSFKISRKTAEPVQTADGTQEARYIFVGEVTVAGKATFVTEDDTEYLRYLNGDKPALDFLLALDANNSLDLHATKAKYTDASIDRGSKYVQTSVEFAGIDNATDAGASGGISPCKVTGINSRPAATFA
jgi:hypothetical protein